MTEKTRSGYRVLVTGASGQLGRRLVPRLLESGFSVRAHFRSKEKAESHCPPGASTVFGDLLDPGWLEEAASDCEAVIHCAAMVSLRIGSHELMRRINVDGTKAVISACRKKKVRRLVFVSSIVTIGASEDGIPVDEEAPCNLSNCGIPYIDTKLEAERLALQANGPDLEVVVVNPSIMFSLPDRELTEKELRKIPRRVPFYFDFGLNLVETDDVVAGIIAAVNRGRPGERYLLTGENLNPEKAFSLASRHFDIRRPFIKIPVGLLYPVGFLFEMAARVRGKRPKFHRGLARLARYRFYYSPEKARKELGYSPRPLAEFLTNVSRLGGLMRAL
jgi:dihydroflavonol-4-reductase